MPGVFELRHGPLLLVPHATAASSVATTGAIVCHLFARIHLMTLMGALINLYPDLKEWLCLLVKQISPDKNMNFHCTDASFTLPVKPHGFVVLRPKPPTRAFRLRLI